MAATFIEFTHVIEQESGRREQTVFLNVSKIERAVYDHDLKTLAITFGPEPGVILQKDEAVRAMRLLKSVSTSNGP